jgi:hypothetical protein
MQSLTESDATHANQKIGRRRLGVTDPILLRGHDATFSCAALCQRQRSYALPACAALTRIAEDEARHAQLAYRFVAWAIQMGGAAVREAVERAFANALFEENSDGLPSESENNALPLVDCSPPVEIAEILHRHGRLSPQQRDRCRRAALRHIIEPCARKLSGVSLTSVDTYWAMCSY